MSWDDAGWVGIMAHRPVLNFSICASSATTSAHWPLLDCFTLVSTAADFSACAPPPPLISDAEQVRAIEREMRAAAFRAAGWPPDEWPARQAAAEGRAEQLLRRFLTPQQQADLQRRRRFRVVAPSGRAYHVWRGAFRNVVELNEALPIARWCLHPVTWVPPADVMLAQKLLLETREREFRHLANRSELAAFWM